MNLDALGEVFVVVFLVAALIAVMVGGQHGG